MPAYTLYNWLITALTKIYKSKAHYMLNNREIPSVELSSVKMS